MFVMAACANQGEAATNAVQQPEPAPTTAVLHAYDADSAYAYVKAQVDMGPRVPGTKEHDRCAQYLVARLAEFGADSILEQKGTVTAFDGTKLPITNISARFNGTDPKAKSIVLLAHYDTRPWADEDPDPNNHGTPIDGANDGASGVGVLLEVARQLGMERPAVNVEIFLTDAEDYGSSDGLSEDSWCLGTQYYLASNPYGGERPAYGILLDMVGGRDATFCREQFSELYAKPVNDKVWAQAKSAGLSSRFVDRIGGAITDDHLYFLKARIPTIDIIEMNNASTGSFPPYWHTLGDNMDNIDRGTLGAVGRVVTSLIYSEK